DTTRDHPAWFHPGRSAVLRLGPKIELAHFGEVHPETLQRLDIAGPIAAFEVFLGALPPPRRKGAARTPLDAVDLLPVRRDFAFVLGRDVAAGEGGEGGLAAGKKMGGGVNVVDLFEARALGGGREWREVE